MNEDQEFLYAGFSGATLGLNTFDLGNGVILRKTFAHLMSPCLMAFSPPGPDGVPGGLWKAVKGGFGYDINIELQVPAKLTLGKNIDAKEVVWWIAALCRMGQVPFLTVPAISNESFEAAKIKDGTEPTIIPFEIVPRILAPSNEEYREIAACTLEWVRAKWVEAGKLLDSNPAFYSAVKVFDTATARGRTSSSLLALWGGIEQIFAPSPGELRFRVASALAAYLETPGNSRFDLYKKILRLYNDRSVAAHTAKEMDHGPLLETFCLMRDALKKMIDENCVPTQEMLESKLFGCT